MARATATVTEMKQESMQDPRTGEMKPVSPEFVTRLRESAAELDEKKKERKALNEAISAIYAKFEAFGLNKKAVRAAITYQGMDEEQRKNYDRSYQTMRHALGMPVQTDMFMEMAKQELDS